jgi:hypothetical protein
MTDIIKPNEASNEVQNTNVEINTTESGIKVDVSTLKGLSKALNTKSVNRLDDSIHKILAFYMANNPDCELIQKRANSTLDKMHELEPQDAIEEMLLMQLVFTHDLFIKSSSAAITKDQNPIRVDDQVVNLTKLSRLFINQLKALNSYRNKGQQKVVVQHVQVSEGANAIIGTVNNSQHKEEGGGKKNGSV